MSMMKSSAAARLNNRASVSPFLSVWKSSTGKPMEQRIDELLEAFHQIETERLALYHALISDLHRCCHELCEAQIAQEELSALAEASKADEVQQGFTAYVERQIEQLVNNFCNDLSVSTLDGAWLDENERAATGGPLRLPRHERALSYRLHESAPTARADISEANESPYGDVDQDDAAVMRQVVRHRRLLQTIQDNKGITQTELAQKLNVRKSNLSQVLNRLSKYGLFVASKNGKYKQYTLTDRGTRCLGDFRMQDSSRLSLRMEGMGARSVLNVGRIDGGYSGYKFSVSARVGNDLAAAPRGREHANRNPLSGSVTNMMASPVKGANKTSPSVPRAGTGDKVDGTAKRGRTRGLTIVDVLTHVA